MTCLDRNETQARNTTAAKKHLRAVHYHAAFYDAPSHYIGDHNPMHIPVQTANLLLRHGDARLNINAEGDAFLSPTKTGSKNYDGNAVLRNWTADGYALVSEVPRYDRTAGPVDTHAALMAVIETMVLNGHRFSLGKMF
jgi:hypothetical protein